MNYNIQIIQKNIKSILENRTNEIPPDNVNFPYDEQYRLYYSEYKGLKNKIVGVFSDIFSINQINFHKKFNEIIFYLKNKETSYENFILPIKNIISKFDLGLFKNYLHNIDTNLINKGLVPQDNHLYNNKYYLQYEEIEP